MLLSSGKRHCFDYLYHSAQLLNHSCGNLVAKLENPEIDHKFILKSIDSTVKKRSENNSVNGAGVQTVPIKENTTLKKIPSKMAKRRK